MKQDILQRDDIPKALHTMLFYIRSLSFMQWPDYDYLQTLVKDLCNNPLDLTTWPEWLCGDSIPSMYESRPLVSETKKLVERPVIDEHGRYLTYLVSCLQN